MAILTIFKVYLQDPAILRLKQSFCNAFPTYLQAQTLKTMLLNINFVFKWSLFIFKGHFYKTAIQAPAFDCWAIKETNESCLYWQHLNEAWSLIRFEPLAITFGLTETNCCFPECAIPRPRTLAIQHLIFCLGSLGTLAA